MNETRKKILEAELALAVERRKRLDGAIAYFREELGLPPAEIDAPEASSAGNESGSADQPANVRVSEGEFFGMSGPKAARIVLERSGRSRPLKTEVIFEAVKKGGVKIGSAGALYRSLFRDDDFVKVGRGIWGLSIWYGSGVRKSRGESEPTTMIESSEPSTESDQEQERPDEEVA